MSANIKWFDGVLSESGRYVIVGSKRYYVPKSAETFAQGGTRVQVTLKKGKKRRYVVDRVLFRP